MTSNPSGPYHERAIRHEARARNYRRQAELMRERDADLDCAAALLYESAKQCINAVGNQRGQNPGTTGGKVNVIRGIGMEVPNGIALMQNWQRADQLHIHADRGHLNADQFIEAWGQTQSFINNMLTIYHRDT